MMGMTNPETVHYGMWDGSSIVICAYVLTLILITLKRKEYPHVFTLLVPASVIFLAILYFPPIYHHLPFTGDSDKRQIFRRFRWILMMLPTLSFAVSYIFTKVGRKQKAMIAVVMAMLMLSSVFYTSDGYEEYGFWDRSNAQDHLYKIPHVVKAMGDTIMEKSGDYLAQNRANTVSLLISDDGEGEWEDSMEYKAWQLKTYISPVKWKDVVISQEMLASDDFDLRQVLGKEYNYVLCRDDELLIKIYEADCYKREWQIEGYCLLSHV